MTNDVQLAILNDAISKFEAEVAEASRRAGVFEGRKQITDEVTEFIRKERAAILEQGREEGRASVTPLIEAAREAGRIGGVVEGRAMAESADVEKNKNEGYREGKKDGQREGYKTGRGEGYKNGWNDAINTPARDHKPK
tara:strand:- start:258 stop:674 length:417 start_codon:yes stop_codon:yes gene_type:complete